MKRITVRRGRRWGEVRRRFPNFAAAAAVVLALVGILAALSSLAALPRQIDLNGAPLHQLTGVVTEIGYQQRAYVPQVAWKPWRRRLALLSVDGHFLDISQLAHDDAPWLRVGQRVIVAYRQGRSGRWYLEAVELPPDQP